jgi:hypothetical protein
MTLHRRMSTLTEPQSPTVIADRVLFTFGGSARATPAGEPPARYVAAAFAHEDFAQRHAYRIVRNETSDPDNPNETIETRVFALAYRIPPDLERLEYRIVVDGLWRTDPTNPNTTRDENGVLLSVFELPERPAAEAGVPRVYQDGRVEFIFEPEVGAGLQTIRDVMTEVGTEEGLNVYVAGSFNNWNPFMHRLRETETGVYRVTIPVPPGRHHYYLVINGQRILDPENGTRTRHRDGFQVCSFTVP